MDILLLFQHSTPQEFLNFDSGKGEYQFGDCTSLLCMQGAVGALYGPLHGGANEAVLRMLSRIGTRENVPSFIEAVKSRREIMFGFGHRVYKNYDPRAKIIRYRSFCMYFKHFGSLSLQLFANNFDCIIINLGYYHLQVCCGRCLFNCWKGSLD